jgi:hypothetical protein
MENITLPKILLKQRIDPADIVVVSNQESNLKSTPELDAMIQQKWQQRLREVDAYNAGKAENEKKIAYDGVNYRLNGFSSQNNQLRLELSTVNFSTYMGLQYEPSVLALGEDYFTKIMYAAGVVRTTDDFYVFGKLAGRTLEDGVIHDFLGGVLTPREVVLHSGKDINAALIKELEEEASIRVEQIALSQFVGMTLDPKLNIGLHFHVDLNIDKETLYRQFNEGHDHEMQDLTLVPRALVAEFLTKLGNEHALAVTLNDF